MNLMEKSGPADQDKPLARMINAYIQDPRRVPRTVHGLLGNRIEDMTSMKVAGHKHCPGICPVPAPASAFT